MRSILFLICLSIFVFSSFDSYAQTSHTLKNGKTDINAGNSWNPNGGNPCDFAVNSGDTWACNASASTSGALNLGSVFNVTNNSTCTITGGTVFTIASAGTFNNATGSTTIVNASNSFSVSGSLTNSGTLTNNGTITVNSSGKFTNATGATLTIASSFTNAGTTTLAGNVTITGSFTNTGTLNINGNLTVTGTLTNSGTINCGASSSVTYNGSLTQNAVAASFQNLVINNSSGVNLSGTTTVNGTLTMTSGKLVLGSNTLTCNSVISGMSAANSFTANGSSNLSLGASASGNVFLNNTTPSTTNRLSTLSNAGTITLSNALESSSSIANTGSLTISSTFTVSGTLTNSGTINCGASSTVIFNSTSAQNIPVASYQNLTVNNSAGVSLLGNTTINGNAVFTSGKITLGSNQLTLNGPISGMSYSNTFLANGSSSLSFGSDASGTILMDTTTDGTSNQVTNFSFNGNIALGNPIKVSGIVTPNGGSLITNDSLYFVSSSSSSYAQLGIGAGSINGDIIYQMYVDSGYHQIGAAVSDSIKDLNRGYLSENALYYWHAPTSFWTAADSMDLFTAGVGYYAYLGNVSPGFSYFFETPGVIELQGPANRGSYSIPLYYHDGTGSNASFGAAGAGGWNLISNPYPSQLDWEAISLPANLNDAFYIYKPEDDSYTSYVNGSGTNGGTQYIPPMQAIFTQTNASLGAGSVNLNLDSTHRVTNQSTVFYKNGSPFQSIRFKLKNIQANAIDEHVLRFAEGASAQFDGAFDAVKFENGTNVPNIYSFDENNKSYSINTFPRFDTNFSYPLTIHAKFVNQEFEISSILEENTENWKVYLEDKVLKKYHLLSSSSYKFISHVKDVNSTRFVIHLIKNRDITTVRNLEKALIGLRQTQEQVYLNLPDDNGTTAYLNLYDLQGKLIWITEVNKVGEVTIQLPSDLNGAYILKASYLGEEQSIKIIR